MEAFGDVGSVQTASLGLVPLKLSYVTLLMSMSKKEYKIKNLRGCRSWMISIIKHSMTKLAN